MNPEKKIILISLVLGLASLIFIVFFISALIKEIKNNSLELAYLEKNINSFRDNGENLNSLKELYKIIEPYFVKINNMFIDAEVPVELIKFWEKIAAELKISMNISTADFKKEKGNLWDYINFNISLSGSFSNFLKFVKKIESGPYLSEITVLSVGRSSQTNVSQPKNKADSENITAVLTVKVYTK